jgi:hypothetical protein
MKFLSRRENQVLCGELHPYRESASKMGLRAAGIGISVAVVLLLGRCGPIAPYVPRDSRLSPSTNALAPGNIQVNFTIDSPLKIDTSAAGPSVNVAVIASAAGNLTLSPGDNAASYQQFRDTGQTAVQLDTMPISNSMIHIETNLPGSITTDLTQQISQQFSATLRLTKQGQWLLLATSSSEINQFALRGLTKVLLKISSADANGTSGATGVSGATKASRR